MVGPFTGFVRYGEPTQGSLLKQLIELNCGPDHFGGTVTRLLVVAPDRELTAQLSFAGYQVASATTGAGALRLLGEHHVDLIVVDIEIPDLMALARNRPVLTERPPVLCVTACEFLGTLVPSLGSEIEDYVTKP